MVDANLMRRIALGEDSRLELKSVLLADNAVKGPKRRDFADELAALANGRGGTLVLGVDDKTRSVQGIPLNSLDAVEGWVREICNDSIEPALEADILRVELHKEDGSDPIYEREHLAKLDGSYGLGECYLTINLGEEYGGFCYKLIVAIMEPDRR